MPPQAAENDTEHFGSLPQFHRHHRQGRRVRFGRVMLSVNRQLFVDVLTPVSVTTDRGIALVSTCRRFFRVAVCRRSRPDDRRNVQTSKISVSSLFPSDTSIWQPSRYFRFDVAVTFSRSKRLVCFIERLLAKRK